MSLRATQFILDKINTLHQSMSMDEARIAPIERDLMLSYVRQLYELVLDLHVEYRSSSIQKESVGVTPAINNAGPTKPKPVAETPKPVVETPKPVVETPKPVAETPKPVAETPKPVAETPKPVVETPKPVVETPKPVVETPKPVAETPKPVVETPKPVVETPKPVAETPKPVAETPKPVAETPKPSKAKIPEEVLALFEVPRGNELLDRLSQMPIADLTRAFGLNDRLLNIGELFAGNSRYFDETLKELNSLSSYSEAEQTLHILAVRFHWAGSEERKKAARNFLKVVRRRFK